MQGKMESRASYLVQGRVLVVMWVRVAGDGAKSKMTRDKGPPMPMSDMISKGLIKPDTSPKKAPEKAPQTIHEEPPEEIPIPA